MDIAYRLTPGLRRKLKDPIGVLIRGSFAETMNHTQEITAKNKPAMIVSVGDTVTRNLLERDLMPKLSIIDNIAMRKRTQPILRSADRSIRVENPQGTITSEAIGAIRESFATTGSVRIIVDGEEDMLTLIVILYAPIGSIVIYGQPHEGIVIVDVTEGKKEEVEAILRTMKNGRKAK